MPESLQLQQVADLKGGFAFKSKDYTDAGRFILRTVNIDATGRVSRQGATYISEEKAKEYERFSLKAWDTLFVMVGATLGKIGLVKECDLPALLNQNMWVVRPDCEKVNPRYLHYAFSLKSKELLGWASGAARDFVRRDDFRQMQLQLPDRKEQDRIAEFMGALDDKIELNRKMNKTLEAMAQAIFKSWFVDFEPFRDGGMVDSELGPIPKGWKVMEIGAAVKVVGGSTPSTKKPEFWEGGDIHWTTPKGLSSATSPVLLDTSRKITAAGLEKISSGLLPIGTFLLSSRAPVGYTTIACVPIAVNQGYIAIPPGGKLSNYYLLHWTRHNLDRIRGRAGGTTFQEISKRNFRPMLVAVPPADVMSKFDDVIAPLFDRIENNERQSQTLAELRDTLLPKLISGEVRVPKAGKLVKEAER